MEDEWEAEAGGVLLTENGCKSGNWQICSMYPDRQFAENNFYDLVGLYQSSLEVVKSNAINSEINPKYFLEPAVN